MSFNLVSVETEGGELPAVLQLMLGDGNPTGIDIHIRATTDVDPEDETAVRLLFTEVLAEAATTFTDDALYREARSSAKAATEVAELEEILAIPSYVNPFADDVIEVDPYFDDEVPPGSWGE